jgi:hypothetical protein
VQASRSCIRWAPTNARSLIWLLCYASVCNKMG